MIIRLIGAGCIVAGSGILGIMYTLEHYRTVRMIRQLISAIEYMERELRYRQLPVPELLLNTADYCGGIIKPLFTRLSERICSWQDCDIAASMNTILQSFKTFPEVVAELCRGLGKCMGHFDLRGQLEGFDGMLSECRTPGKICRIYPGVFHA